MALPATIQNKLNRLAYAHPLKAALTGELAVNFAETNGSLVSEASVYRLLKDHGLITSPAFILMKAANLLAFPTTAPNQLWQTDGYSPSMPSDLYS